MERKFPPPSLVFKGFGGFCRVTSSADRGSPYLLACPGGLLPSAAGPCTGGNFSPLCPVPVMTSQSWVNYMLQLVRGLLGEAVCCKGQPKLWFLRIKAARGSCGREVLKLFQNVCNKRQIEY